MFKLPNITGGNKRRFEPATEDAIKKVRLHDESSYNNDEQQISRDKGKGKAVTIADEEDEVEYINAHDDDDNNDDNEDEDGRFFGGGLTDQQKEILDVFDKAERNVNEINLTPQNIRKQLMKFDKCIRKNVELRGKYPDDPNSFIESEIDLDESIHELKNFSQNPSMAFSQLLKNVEILEKIVNLLSHENTDIALDVVEVLEELTDDDILEEINIDGDDILQTFVDKLLEYQLLELLISNLGRLNENLDTDIQGVFHTLSLIENLLSLRPSLSESICEQTPILSWLINRLNQSTFNQNKQYTSEILSILLQNSKKNKLNFVSNIDNIDIVLKSISKYKNINPKDGEELEYLENLFNILCSLLLENEVKTKFNKLEGIELMVLIAQQKKLISSYRSIKVLDHALSNEENSEKFININGLKILFGFFMNKSSNSFKNSQLSFQDLEEHILGILVSLFTNIPSETSNRIRLLKKFVENDYEKVDKLLEFKSNSENRLNKFFNNHDFNELDEDDIYLQKLEFGLFSLQLSSYILAWLIMEDDGIKDHIQLLLQRNGQTFNNIIEVLKEYSDNMGDEKQNEELSQKDIVNNLIEYLISL